MKKICLVVLLFGVIIIYNSCNKIFGVNGTYTIKGKYFKDCTGEPVVGYNLRLKVQTGYGKSDNIGFDTTDVEGNYEFKNISLKYIENVRILHDIDENSSISLGGEVLLGNIINGDVINWNFYGNRITYTVAKFNINSSHFNTNDTLYIGYNVDYKSFYPIPSQTVVTFQSTGGPGRPTNKDFGLIWGKNKKDFDSARNSMGRYHMVYSKSATCVYPDTTYISIP